MVLSCTVSEIRRFIGRQNCQFLPTPVSLALGDPFDFRNDQIFAETRMFGLSDGEKIMTLTVFVLIQYRSVTDGRTDRRTEGQTFLL